MRISFHWKIIVSLLLTVFLCSAWVYSSQANPSKKSQAKTCLNGAKKKAYPSPPRPCWRPFSKQSPFNQKIKGPSSPRSKQVIKRLTSFHPDSPGPWKFSTNTGDTRSDYAHPLFLIPRHGQRKLKTVRIHCNVYSCPEIEGDKILVPKRARPARGGDGHMGIVNYKTGWEHDFWQVKRITGNELIASSGDKTRLKGKGRGAGATASEFALSLGQIRLPEMRQKKIPHALFLTVLCTNGKSVYPAQENPGRECKEIGLKNKGAPRMGERIYLKMSKKQINNLKAPSWQKTILRALKNYGGFVGDTGGTSWGVMLESGTTYTSYKKKDPWIKWSKRQKGVIPWQENGRRTFVFDMRYAVNWKKYLRVDR